MLAKATKWLALVVFLFSISFVRAQSISPGTALPVMLATSLDARHDKPEKVITAKLMQDVSLPDGTVIRKGARITGQVLGATLAGPGAPAREASSTHSLQERR